MASVSQSVVKFIENLLVKLIHYARGAVATSMETTTATTPRKVKQKQRGSERVSVNLIKPRSSVNPLTRP